MPLRPGGARHKGSAGERELAMLLKGWAQAEGVELDLSRNLEQTRKGGHDLVGLEAYGMAVEVKRVEGNGLRQWWAQAVAQANVAGGLTPVLAHRRNRQPWSFRVRAWVYPAASALDIDMDQAAFRDWFLARLKQ